MKPTLWAANQSFLDLTIQKNQRKMIMCAIGYNRSSKHKTYEYSGYWPSESIVAGRCIRSSSVTVLVRSVSPSGKHKLQLRVALYETKLLWELLRSSMSN